MNRVQLYSLCQIYICRYLNYLLTGPDMLLTFCSMHMQVTQFLYRTIGLEFGVNAVITNGRVSIFLRF